MGAFMAPILICHNHVNLFTPTKSCGTIYIYYKVGELCGYNK